VAQALSGARDGDLHGDAEIGGVRGEIVSSSLSTVARSIPSWGDEGQIGKRELFRATAAREIPPDSIAERFRASALMRGRRSSP